MKLFTLRKYQYLLLLITLQLAGCLSRIRHTRTTEGTNEGRGVRSPLLGDEIDLETIEGVEQVTKLVLLKTDSLPGESDERIDGRYLNSLMETLYTGLRKPFKSVSADILGIFPSFEEIQVRCGKPNSNEHLEKDESIRIKRHLLDEKLVTDRNNLSRTDTSEIDRNLRGDNVGNETVNLDTDSSYVSYKSSLQVCQAVTDDCLSMDDLIQILPPSVTTFDKTLVRLCPIMLFRIMNHLCHKSSDNRHDKELISAYQSGKIQEVQTISRNGGKDSISLNTLQMLKNLQNSDELATKKPQKLHKKLKTQTAYKNNGRINSGNLQQPDVDEQLLKIRLKLNEPSIEKVWIFSLLFVILSIVVSMGGLIVLPFVKKTTRRRILTLFEGLAVGGLAGSATLHMFPQAFGLVDENYHKYFWRIFVVFFGIYLCYLCERTIKIFKVIRAKMRRRSHASLIDMDYCYGFPSVSREISGDRSRPARNQEQRFNFDPFNQHHQATNKKKYWVKKRIEENESFETCKDFNQHGYLGPRKSHKNHKMTCDIEAGGGCDKKYTKGKSDSKRHEKLCNRNQSIDNELSNNASEVESLDMEGDQSNNPTRQRLIKCLKSVQRQFSPVYAVQTQNWDGIGPTEEQKSGRSTRVSSYLGKNGKSVTGESSQTSNSRRNRLLEPHQIVGKFPSRCKVSVKRQMKQKEMETMLYHKNLMKQQQNRDEANLERGYLQPRLSSVKDVAAERQDQDNAARMSVDTVAWMIVFGDAVLNVIDGLSIGAAFERNILAGISISVAVMLEEVTHRLGTFAVLIRAGMSMQQSLLCTFLSACALFPGLIIGILLSDATEDATPYIFCAAGGIFLYMVSLILDWRD